MARAATTSCAIATDVLCAAGGQTRIDITSWQRLTGHRSTGLDSYVQLQLPLGHDALAEILPGRILRVWFEDDTFEEWYLREDVHLDASSGVATIRAVDLIYRLAAPGPVREISAVTGLPNYDFSFVDATAAEIVADPLLVWLAAQGIPWAVPGTFDFTTRLESFDWQRLNAVEALVRLRDAEPIRGELALRRNGVTNYQLDLVREINGAGTTPIDVRQGKSLLGLERTRSFAEHFPVIQPFGERAPDGTESSLAEHIFRVKAIDTGTQELELEDPLEPTALPFIVADQANGLALTRLHYGGHHSILDTIGQEVMLASVAGYRVGQLVRLAAAPGTHRLWNLSTFGSLNGTIIDNQPQPVPMAITAVNGGTREVTYNASHITAGGWGAVDPLRADDLINGWTASILQSILTTTSAIPGWDAVTRKLAVNSVVGVAVGDQCFLPALQLRVAEVEAIDSVSVPKTVTLKSRYHPSIPVGSTFPFGGWTVQFWREIATSAVEESFNDTATAGRVRLVSVAGVTTAHRIDFFRLARPTALLEVSSPADVALTAHRAVGAVDLPGLRGEGNYLPNGGFRDWPGGANAVPGGGYTVDATLKTKGLQSAVTEGGAPGRFSVRIRLKARTTIVFGPYAIGSVTFNVMDAGDFEVGDAITLGVESFTVLSTFVHPTPATGLSTVTMTTPSTLVHNDLEVMTEAGANRSIPSHQLRIRLHPPGSPPGRETWRVLAKVRAEGLGAATFIALTGTPLTVSGLTTPPVNLTSATLGTWVYLEASFTVVDGQAIEAAIGISTTVPVPGGAIVYVEGLALVQANYPLVDQLPDSSFATAMWHGANGRLAESRSVPTIDRIEAIDVTRLDAARWPDDELLVGRWLEIAEPTTGAMDTRRVLELDPDYDAPGRTALVLGRRRPTLSVQLVTAAVQAPIVDVGPDGTPTLRPTTLRTGLDFSSSRRTPEVTSVRRT